jgi:IS4 transposase
VLVFLTNHLTLAAATVAEVYKRRWQIELVFKAMKQSLRIKIFVGTSANALKTQIWAALITILLTKYLQPATEGNLWLVAVESGGAAAAAVLCLQ